MHDTIKYLYLQLATLFLSSNFYVKALYLHNPFCKNDSSYKDSPPPPQSFRLPSIKPSPPMHPPLELSSSFYGNSKNSKNYFEGSCIVGEEQWRRARAKWRRVERNQQTPSRLCCSFARCLHKTANYLAFHVHTYPASGFF